MIFTDGASRRNPGPGGWGAIVVLHSNVTELGGAEQHTTNNRMELSAAIAGLSLVSSHSSVTVYTDSNYMIDGITKWIQGWKRRDWITKEKKEVLNRDLWEELALLVERKDENISWQYVSGHVGIPGNERCDEIATSFAAGEKPHLYQGPISHYGIDILNVTADAVKQVAKTQSRSHSKAKAYSYLSMIDRNVERHVTWSECEKRVKGKNAKFKKALSADDEREILKSWGVKQALS